MRWVKNIGGAFVGLIVVLIIVMRVTKITSRTCSGPTSARTNKYELEDNYTVIVKKRSFPDVPAIQHELIRFHYLPANICTHEYPELLLIVQTGVKNFENREILRRTIGRHSHFNGVTAQMVFVAGLSDDQRIMEKLKAEVDAYGDVLVPKFVDSYTRMTYKAVAWLKWYTDYCSGAKYVLKFDDDTFVHLYYISEMLKPCIRHGSQEALCTTMGCLHWTFGPLRNPWDKNSLSESEYSRSWFPPFCPGVALFIPGSLIPRLLYATKFVQYLWLDDVYLSGLLMEFTGKKHHRMNNVIVSTINQKREYEDVDLAYKIICHFKHDVLNGVYERHWHIVERIHGFQPPDQPSYSDGH